MRRRHDRDEQRFQELFVECAPALLAYAVRRTARPEDAADIVADTFLVAWRRLDDVPRGEDARLWLYGVARRVGANQRRGQLRRSGLAERLRREIEAVVPDPAPAVAEGQVVRAALASLDAQDRELLQLTSWERLTPGELAVALDIPAATVRTRLHRARGRMRAALEAQGWGGERSALRGHERDDEHVLVQEREQGR